MAYPGKKSGAPKVLTPVSPSPADAPPSREVSSQAKTLEVRALTSGRVRYGANVVELERGKIFRLPIEFARWLQSTGRAV